MGDRVEPEWRREQKDEAREPDCGTEREDTRDRTEDFEPRVPALVQTVPGSPDPHHGPDKN